MSSEVQAKWMNSRARCASSFFASRARSHSSMAFTSWLVSASMLLICCASFSEKFFSSPWNAESVFVENPFSSLMARSAASACSHSSSMRAR